MNDFPQELFARFKVVTTQLKKVQRATFKRFAPNVAEVADEFNQLAICFNNAYMPQYAALCWLGASKCEESAKNYKLQIHFILKSSRAFIDAYNEDKRRCIKSEENVYCLEGALKGYNHIQSILDDDSPLKAAAIREMKKYHANTELTSGFVSPAHRYYDLEQSASESIVVEDYAAALDKHTEICDDIVERKTTHLYCDLIRRNELARILLLLLLNLPPSRQSASHIKLLERLSHPYSSDNFCQFSNELYTLVADLIDVDTCKNYDAANDIVDEIIALPSLTPEHRLLLRELSQMYID